MTITILSYIRLVTKCNDCLIHRHLRAITRRLVHVSSVVAANMALANVNRTICSCLSHYCIVISIAFIVLVNTGRITVGNLGNAGFVSYADVLLTNGCDVINYPRGWVGVPPTYP